MMEDVNTGWLVKSPGTRYVKILKGKLQTPVKAKWRRRYFRLHKLDGVPPSQYVLSYYSDNSLQRRLGSINIDDCEKIQASLDSAFYQHLFSIQTSTKQKRLYYLAADTEDEMSKWVDSLCRLCNLQDASRFSDNNIDRDTNVHMFRNEELSNQILDEIDQQRSDQGLGSCPSARGVGRADSYRELSECYSGVDDIPVMAPPTVPSCVNPDREPNEDYEVPPPPTSIYPVIPPASPHSPKYDNGYDVPPPTSPVRYTSIRKPNRTANPEQVESVYGTVYDSTTSTVSPPKPGTPTPKPRMKVSISNNDELNSSSSLVNQHSEMQRLGVTDMSGSVKCRENPAPSEQSHSSSDPSHTSSELSQEVVYENPSVMVDRLSEVQVRKYGTSATPPRPPKIPQTSNTASDSDGEEYQNCSNLAPQHQSHLDGMYDIPKSLASAPQPLHCVGPSTKIHKYVNASAKFIVSQSVDQEVYSEVHQSDNRAIYQPVKPARDDAATSIYLQMDINQLKKLDLETSDTEDYMSPNLEDIYDIAPPSRPMIANHTTSSSLPTPHRPPKPQKLLKPGSSSGDIGQSQSPAAACDTDVLQIRQSPRTKSYVRDSVFSDGEENNTRCSLIASETGIILPKRIASSSEDEEEDSSDSGEDSSDNIYDVPPSRPPALMSNFAHSANESNNNSNSLIGVTPQAPARPSKVVPAKRIVSASQNSTRPEHMPAADADSSYDIQYVELDQRSLSSSSNSPLNPTPNSRSLAGGVPCEPSVEYVQIDARRTGGLGAALKERKKSLKLSNDN